MKRYFLLSIILWMCMNGYAQTTRETTQKIDQFFKEWNDNPTAPGVAAGLVQNGEILYLKGFGTANIEHNIPITTDTKFQLGNLSKQVTAFAVLLLEEQGKLKLTDDVRKYVPQLPDFGKTITLQHLLSQSSGLHSFWAMAEIAGWDSRKILTQAQALQLICTQKQLEYKPGTQFSITYSGLVLLTEVIEQVSGKSFGTFTKEAIFQPLGMNNTLFCEDSNQIIPNAAVPYQQTEQGYKKHPAKHAIPMLNLYSSAADLCRWYIYLDEPKLGSPTLMKKMNSPVTLDNGTTYKPTRGELHYNQLSKHAERGVPKFWEYNISGGYASNVFTFPNQKLTAFVIGNNNHYNGSPTMQMAFEAFGDIFPKPPNIDFSKVKSLQLSAEKLATFEGNYLSEERSYLRRLYVKNDTLHYETTVTGYTGKLIPISENTFQMIVGSDDEVFLRFEGKAKQKRIIYTSGDSDEIIFKQFESASYSEKDLSAFTGTYYCDALNVAYTFQVQDGKLIANALNQATINFTTTKPDVFISNRWYLGGIHFNRNTDGRVAGFSVHIDGLSGLEFRKLSALMQ